MASHQLHFVFVYGTLKHGFDNFNKFIKPHLVEDRVEKSIERLGLLERQDPATHRDSVNINDAVLGDSAHPSVKEIVDVLLADKEDCEDIKEPIAKGYCLAPNASLLLDPGQSVELYVDDYYCPYCIIKDEANSSETSPLVGEVFLVNKPMLAKLDEAEGIASGRYARSTHHAKLSRVAQESGEVDVGKPMVCSVQIYNFLKWDPRLRRIGSGNYNLEKHIELFVPRTERKASWFTEDGMFFKPICDKGSGDLDDRMWVESLKKARVDKEDNP